MHIVLRVALHKSGHVMARESKDCTIQFRLSERLKSRLDATAAARNWSVSDLVREVLDEGLRVSDMGETGTLIEAASAGVLDAQRQMRENCIALAESYKGQPDLYRKSLDDAEWWSRLASVRGNHGDRLRLLGIVCFQVQRAADHDEPDIHRAFLEEAITLSARLADEGREGSEFSAVALNVLVDEATPDMAQSVQHFVGSNS